MSAVETNSILAAAVEHEPLLLSLIVPMYNVGEEARETLRRLQSFRAAQSYGSELIVVDDGSETPVLDVIAGSGLEDADIRFIRLDQNCGKGYAVARGMAAARGHYRIFIDADLAYPPSQIQRILGTLRAGADVAVASRKHPESRAVWRRASLWQVRGSHVQVGARYLASRAFNAAVRFTLLAGIRDTQAGLKGFSAEASRIIFQRLSIPRFAFDVEALVIARRHGLTIEQTGVTFRATTESTTVRWCQDTVRMARDLIAVFWRVRRGCYD